MNLTGARSPEARVRVLVQDPLEAREFVPTGRLIDIGSGNGSPGLVLALLRPDLRVTLLEPRLKRWAFLKEAVRGLGREVEVLRLRHEDYSGEPADTLSLRGLSLPLGSLGGLVRPGGELLIFGGKPKEEPPFKARGRQRLATLDLHRFERST